MNQIATSTECDLKILMVFMCHMVHLSVLRILSPMEAQYHEIHYQTMSKNVTHYQLLRNVSNCVYWMYCVVLSRIVLARGRMHEAPIVTLTVQ